MQTVEKVRLKADPGRVGFLTGKTREVGGQTYYQVDFLHRSEYHAADQLEPASVSLDPIECLREGRLGRVQDLKRTITHARLSGRLANLIYSMETTNTDFHAYQFKPVLKLLNSPTKGILIADEVGLGKTIEAGLIWTELRSRYEERRLMVLCLAMLREKWRYELRNRFGISSDVVGVGETLEYLQQAASDTSYTSFSLVASMQGLRPRRGWDSDEEELQDPASKLSRFLENRAEEEPLIDLLVIDEAHYLRNPESMTNALARRLCAVSNRVLLLSATPIHLKSSDLYYLLNLVDPETFNQPTVFDSILQANGPIVKARDRMASGDLNTGGLLELLREAGLHPYLRHNRQLRSLIDELADGSPRLDDHEYRSNFTFRLDGVNLLNNVVTRTRKRDVHEWRVVREVVPQKVSMKPAEREFYEAVTSMLRDFCRRYRQHEGFLLVMPERQMSSSMPAALREWQRRRDLYGESYFEDFGIEDVEAPGPVLQEIFRNLEGLGDLDALWQGDSKYDELLRILGNLIREKKGEKIVLFSYFKPTLGYLAERLEQDGVSASILSGDSEIDKNEILRRFEEPNGPQVLLSSEVGSEGLDLQFSRILINYDLPWNPMRVEQRIGRLDRIGQRAEKIVIWNLMYEDTIDSRIYDRLYLRLNIFEGTLGGLEPILGSEIRKLTNDLLRDRLSEEQQKARIDQTAMALANKKNEEEHLENEAVSLVAHGDYILQQVHAAQELKRWIRGSDIREYVIPFLRERYSGSRFERVSTEDEGLYDIALSEQAKHEFEEFLRTRRLLGKTALIRNDPAPIRSRFENKVVSRHRDRAEVINQLHPLVRFVSQELEAAERTGYPAVCLRIGRDEVRADVSEGVYVFAIQRWAVEGVQTKEQIAYFAARLDDEDTLLDEATAEEVVVTAAMAGTDWLDAPHTENFERIAHVATRLLFGDGQRAYEVFVRRVKDENQDRADVQEKTVSRHLEDEERRWGRVKAEHLAAGRRTLAQATEGRLTKVRSRVERRLLQIQAGKKLGAYRQDVCVGVICVEEGP